MLVSDFMTKMIITAEASTPVTNAARVMAAEDIGCLVVTKADVLAGIVAQHDIIGAHLLSEEVYQTMVLADIMTTPVVTVSPEADLGQLIALMHQSGRRHIPVVVGDSITGIVTTTDVIRVLATMKMIADSGSDD
ncbi:MAG: CBS domain-containing protein [Candidatus Thorarchaeota archaeon]|nr:CBS domain-containing protein [Candidatus Thorarchaeota archaeon]